MVSTQYNEMLNVGRTWTKVKPNPGAFIGDGAAVQPCSRCEKAHTCPCVVVHWRRTQPKHGEPHTKPVKGKTFFWCGKCRCWNATHLINAHVSNGEVKKKREEANSGNANIASDVQTDTASSTTDAPTSVNFSSYNLAAISQARNNAFQHQFGILKN
jgi:hypothetical protein